MGPITAAYTVPSDVPYGLKIAGAARVNPKQMDQWAR